MSHLELPIFQATIPDEECGMFRVSLVDNPAVESLFLAFDKQQRVPIYAVANEEKRIVRGVIMRADFPIYRVSPGIGEYYIVFTKDTIRQMAEKYLREGRQNAVNLMHIDGTDVEGVNLLQIFIKDSQNGIVPVGFESIEDGSLFGEYHVANDEVWADIKAGVFKGFSLEGVFDIQPIEKHFSNQKNISKMSVKNKIKNLMLDLLASIEKFGQVTTDKGVLRWEGEEDLKEGDAVALVGEDDSENKAEDGDYTTEDGKVIKIAEGKVAEIVDPKAEVDDTEPVEGADTDPATDSDPAEEDPKDVETLIESISKKLDAINERISKIEKKIADGETKMSAMSAEFSKIKKEPAQMSVKMSGERGVSQLEKNLGF
jgi:hypothetical protein